MTSSYFLGLVKITVYKSLIANYYFAYFIHTFIFKKII